MRAEGNEAYNSRVLRLAITVAATLTLTACEPAGSTSTAAEHCGPQDAAEPLARVDAAGGSDLPNSGPADVTTGDDAESPECAPVVPLCEEGTVENTDQTGCRLAPDACAPCTQCPVCDVCDECDVCPPLVCGDGTVPNGSENGCLLASDACPECPQPAPVCGAGTKLSADGAGCELDLSSEAVQAALAQAEESGHAAGYAAGYAEGQAAGYAEGQAAGYAEGHSAGYAEGQAAGYAEGHAKGYVTGLAEAPSCGCQGAEDCSDGDPCTTDVCDGSCTNDPIPGCCVADDECPPGQSCVGGQCESDSCDVFDRVTWVPDTDKLNAGSQFSNVLHAVLDAGGSPWLLYAEQEAVTFQTGSFVTRREGGSFSTLPEVKANAAKGYGLGLVVRPDGPVVALDQGSPGARTLSLVRWDGGSWVSLGAALGPTVARASVDMPSSGEIVATWRSIEGGVVYGRAGRWTGGAWSAISTPIAGATPSSLAGPIPVLWKGQLHAVFRDGLAGRVVRWDDPVWTEVTPDLGALPDGEFSEYYVAADGERLFILSWETTTAVPVPSPRVAMLEGTTVTQLGGGLTAPPPPTGFGSEHGDIIVIDGAPVVSWWQFGIGKSASEAWPNHLFVARVDPDGWKLLGSALNDQPTLGTFDSQLVGNCDQLWGFHSEFQADGVRNLEAKRFE